MQSNTIKKALLWLGLGVAVCLLVTGAFFAEAVFGLTVVFLVH